MFLYYLHKYLFNLICKMTDVDWRRVSLVFLLRPWLLFFPSYVKLFQSACYFFILFICIAAQNIKVLICKLFPLLEIFQNFPSSEIFRTDPEMVSTETVNFAILSSSFRLF